MIHSASPRSGYTTESASGLPSGAVDEGGSERDTGRSDSWVLVASIVRPQGHCGEVLAESETDFPELFAQRRRLFCRAGRGLEVAPRELALESWRRHGDRLVFKFAGIDSIEAAEELRGVEVLIPRSERAPLEEGAVYYADLVGCTIYDRTTAEVAGTIIGVDRESANLDLLVVSRPEDRGEALIPFAQAYQPAFDLPARRVEMTLPEGLLAVETLPESRAGKARRVRSH